MKLLVISLGALLVAGLAFLIAPDPAIQPAKTIPIMEITTRRASLYGAAAAMAGA